MTILVASPSRLLTGNSLQASAFSKMDMPSKGLRNSHLNLVWEARNLLKRKVIRSWMLPPLYPVLDSTTTNRVPNQFDPGYYTAAD